MSETLESTDPMLTMAQNLVKRGLGAPAIFVLESMKPFSVVAQQSLIATTPFAGLIGYKPLFGQLTDLFSDRQKMEDLMVEMERQMEDGLE